MIRLILLTLLTLTYSCAKAQPEPAEAVLEETAPALQPAPETEQYPTLAADAPDKEQPAAEPKSEPRRTRTKQAAKVKQPVPAVESADESTPVAVLIPQPETEPAQPAEEIIVVTETVAEAPAEIQADAPVLPTFAETSTAMQPRTDKKKPFLPTRQRIDREVNKLKFAYKGEMIMGLTASYGTLTSDDTDYMLIIDNIDASGSVATVKPYVGYFYRDNNCIGARFGYRHVGGTVNGLNLDLGESNDISFNIPYIDLQSNNFSFGIFHRSYAGLDPKGRFGLFAEFELSCSTGTSEFAYETNNHIKRTHSDNFQAKLMFNPGAAVYIFPNVCATLSFGLGGIQYTSVKQKDEQGNEIGTRKASNMKFKLNLAAINFGMTIHLWDKKKK